MAFIQINLSINKIIKKNKNKFNNNNFLILISISIKINNKILLNKINKAKNIILEIDGGYSINKDYKYYNNILFDFIKNK